MLHLTKILKSASIIIIVCIVLFPTFLSAQNSNSYYKIADSERDAAIDRNNSVTTTGSNYDIKAIRCNWNVDPAIVEIGGCVTTFYEPVSILTSLEFDLSSSLTVDSVIWRNINRGFTHVADVLTIGLPTPVLSGTLDSISIYYHGVPPSTGFGSFNHTQHVGADIIWTLSEPYGASDWWPCKNSLTDKIDSLDIFVRTPSINKVASNGLLVDEVFDGTDKIYHWKSKYPIATYLVAIAVTNYSVYNNYVPMGPNDSLLVMNFVYPEDLSSWQAGTPDIISTIQLYDSLLIPYPFKDEKYGHAQFGWGGGMEHQTMTFVVNTWHPLLAHECAHQWFGDHVTTGSWEDIWLNEGFATYMEGLTEQYLYPNDWPSWKSDKIINITSAPSGSVLCDDTTNINRIFSGRLTYNKGAYLLHMLRWQIGDSAFFQGLRNYLNDPLIAGGFARTPQFKSHMELSSGQSLTTFFNQWYNGMGYPSYNVFWSNNNGNVSIEVNQTTSDPASVAFFEMPIPIYLSDGILDTIVVCNNTFNGQVFNFQLPFNPSSVVYDPELWILSNGNAVFTGLDDLSKKEAVSIYPNPANDFVNIVFADKFPTNIQLNDLSGRSISSYPINERKARIDCSALSNQTYILKYFIDNLPYTKKFVVCKAIK